MDERYLVFTGRPNSGKSSIIREITGLDTRSGKRPGTTKRVSVYPLSTGLSLVDMPGYGRITGVSKGDVSRVKDEILDFIESKGGDIAVAVHVIDVATFLEVALRMDKKGFMPLDLEMIRYLNESVGEPPLIAANKVDKLGWERASLLADLEDFIPGDRRSEAEFLVFPVSARTGEGLGVLKDVIHRRLADVGFRTPFKRR